MENKKMILKFLIIVIFMIIVVVGCATKIYLNNTDKHEMNTLPQLRAKGIVTAIDELNKRIEVSTDNRALILELPNTEYCVYSLTQLKKGDQISFLYIPSDYNYSDNSVVILSYEIIDGSSIN